MTAVSAMATQALILMALLVTDAVAAENPAALASSRHPHATYVVLSSSTGSAGLTGGSGGGSGYGGLQGDPDDLIDGNRAKPKPGTTGGPGVGSLLSTVTFSVRLYALMFAGLLR